MKMDPMTRYRWHSAGFLGGEGDPDDGGNGGAGCGCACIIAVFFIPWALLYISSLLYG